MRVLVVWGACLACALWLATSTALAQETAPHYKEWIDRALSESAAGRWDEARAAFRQAHAIDPNARTLRGIGMVSYELRDYVDAVRNLQLALQEKRRPLDDAQRREVVSLLSQARALVASYETAALHLGTEIVVDGQVTRPESDGMLILALGEHQVQLRAGKRMGEAHIVVRGGEQGPLPVALDAETPPTAAAVTPPVPAASAAQPLANPTSSDGHVAFIEDSKSEARPAPAAAVRDDAHTSESRVPVAAIATAASGAVVGGVGVALLLVGLHDKRNVEGAAPGTEWSSLRSADATAPVLTGVGAGMVGLGGALLATGLIWLVLSPTTHAGGEQALLHGGSPSLGRVTW